MLQLIALLFCAAVAFVCLLVLCTARDWFAGKIAAVLAKSAATLLMISSLYCGYRVWYDWDARDLTRRDGATISEKEADQEMRRAARQAGFSAEDADTMTKTLKKFLADHPDALTR